MDPCIVVLFYYNEKYAKMLVKLLSVLTEVSQVGGVFEGGPSKFRDWIRSIEEYVILAGRDSHQTKKLAYHTGQGAVSDCIKCY